MAKHEALVLEVSYVASGFFNEANVPVITTRMAPKAAPRFSVEVQSAAVEVAAGKWSRKQLAYEYFWTLTEAVEYAHQWGRELKQAA